MSDFRALGAILAVAAVGGSPAALHAQEAEVEETVPLVEDVAPSEEESVPLVIVSGFVNTLVNIPVSGYSDADDAVTFGLEQVEVDFTLNPHEDVDVRVDLNYFPANESLLMDDVVEQAWVDYSIGERGFILAGKRNAPVGVEALDQPDRYQITLGQLFTYTTPSNLTGFFGGVRTDRVTVMAWVTDAWDLPTTPSTATFGGRVEVGFDSGYIAASTSYGPVINADTDYYVVDLDTMWFVGDLTLLGEVDIGGEPDWSSFGVMGGANYAFSDLFSLTGRVDYLNREDPDLTIDAVSATLAGLFVINDYLRAIAEVRADVPAEADTAITAALQLTAAG